MCGGGHCARTRTVSQRTVGTKESVDMAGFQESVRVRACGRRCLAPATVSACRFSPRPLLPAPRTVTRHPVRVVFQVSFLPRLPKSPKKAGARDDDEDRGSSRIQDPVATGQRCVPSPCSPSQCPVTARAGGQLGGNAPCLAAAAHAAAPTRAGEGQVLRAVWARV